MKTVVHQRSSVDHCPFCEGIWFDGTELDSVLAQAKAPPVEAVIPSRGISAFTCPRCKPRSLVAMDATGWAGMVLERCPACRGLFVDAPEFKALIRDGRPAAPGLEHSLQSFGHKTGAELLGFEGLWYLVLDLVRKR